METIVVKEDYVISKKDFKGMDDHEHNHGNIVNKD